MKKTAFGILLGSIFLFSGCGTENTLETTEKNQNAKEFVFQEPEKQPEIRGTVKSIVGNEVVVSVRDLSSLPPDVQKTMEEMQKKMKEQRASNGGAISGMGGGMGAGQRPANGSEPTAEMQKIREAMEKIKTIDTKIIFPIGISMVRRSANGMQELSLADIKVGNSVSVWLDESVADKKIAEIVTVMEVRKS